MNRTIYVHVCPGCGVEVYSKKPSTKLCFVCDPPPAVPVMWFGASPDTGIKNCWLPADPGLVKFPTGRQRWL